MKIGQMPALSDSTRGMVYGLIAMLAFSQTLTATRIAVQHLDPVLIGLGRVLLAALPAALLLLWDGRPRPTREQLFSLTLVCFGVTLVFPLLSAWGMGRLPASHGAVLIALLPLSTAVAARFRTRERPSVEFWITALAGTSLVIGFALTQGAGSLQAGDVALLVAVMAGGLGYAEGGALARQMGGWRVICWALVLSAPFAFGAVAVFAEFPVAETPLSVWAAFAYVAMVSQFLGFFLWYQALAIGGVARVSQLQLLMPFFTLLGAWVLLGEVEALSLRYLLFAGMVVLLVALNRRAPIANAVNEDERSGSPLPETEK